MTAETIIKELDLKQHPEGGFYRETYRSSERIKLSAGKTRHTATAIYYLLNEGDKSHFHRVGADEIWLFHQGEPLEILMITDDGNIETKILGDRLELNQEPQITIPANTWFAAHIKEKKGFTLVSCVVAPGFEFDDFELANKQKLMKSFPKIKNEIGEFSL